MKTLKHEKVSSELIYSHLLSSHVCLLPSTVEPVKRLDLLLHLLTSLYQKVETGSNYLFIVEYPCNRFGFVLIVTK